MHDFFIEICIIITVATVLGYLLKTLKQPMIPAYVLAGLIIGPILGIITNPDSILTISEIGIAFLLFIVGLEIDFKKLKNVGLVATLGGFVNSSILFVFGFLLAILLKFKTIEAAYLGLVVAFSSTMVVIKLLSDKRELDTLHGRILVGILLMEDFLAILALSILSNSSLMLSLLRSSVLIISAIALAKFVLPALFRFGAKHQELLFLLSLSTCFVFSMLSLSLGLSVVIGAFLAGVSLANLPYRIEIISRVKPLRDFFSTIFFVVLGMQIILSDLSSLIIPFLIFFSFVTLVKPFVVMSIVKLFKYKKRTIFLTAISLAQISEFSLIIVALGYTMGNLSQTVLTLTILLAITTITASSYILKYDNKLYQTLATHLSFLDTGPEFGDKDENKTQRKNHDVVLCGYNRIGFSIANAMKKLNKNLLVVDYNPETIKELSKKGINCMYGDVGDTEVLERMDLAKVSMVISTVPDTADNILLLQKTRELNNKAAVVVTASQLDEALSLYKAGADYVILPHFLGGEHVSNLIQNFNQDQGNIMHTRLKHLEELQTRKELGHEHPRHD